MTRILVLVLTIIISLTSSIALAGDLYLLSITSTSDLEQAQNIVGFAHGRIGARFIIDAAGPQADRLVQSGLAVELIGEDISLEDTYILARVKPQLAKVPVYLEPLAEEKGSYLVEMSRSSVDILLREGFLAINLKDFVTPLFYNPPTHPAVFRDSYPSDTLADLVSQDSIYAWDTRLEAFQSRMIYSDSIHAARDWLVSKFQSWGYTNVSTELFYYYGQPCYNVRCFKPGTAEPDNLIVVGGHYDSINYEQPDNGLTFAPGADDNASGTSIALEMARILKDVETKKSYLFCAFSAEEVGLVGSYYMAQDLYNSGVYNVEVMLNYDMVGFTLDDYDNLLIYGGDNEAYSGALAAATERVTSLIPEIRLDYGNSDHASFEAFGFNIGSVAEGDFNWDGWHTNLDLSSRLDFPYFTEVARMTAAALGHIDNSVGLMPIEHIWDVGDGQALRIEWGNCNPDYNYSILYGTSSGDYTDTIDIVSVPPCSYDVGGLIQGQTYYFSILALNDDGYGPLTLLEASGTPYVYPQPPQGITIEPDLNVISLAWAPNVELDLNHYRLLRRPEGGEWTVIEDVLYDTYYDDFSVSGHIDYEYLLLAVDNDQNQSDSSAIVSAMAASFDWPLLFVDETASSGGLNPSEEDQAAMYDSLLFFDVTYNKYQINSGDDRLERRLSGQYKSIIWLDDDLATHHFVSSVDSVGWYLDYNSNFLLAGWQTIFWYTGILPMQPGDFMYDRFGITQVTENQNFDFIGAYGQNGWPDLQTDTDNAFNGFLPYISKFDMLPGAEVIYRFKTSSGDSQFENQPCGVMFDSDHGKRIALGFPVYHLTDASATALMNKVFETFGVEAAVYYGDVDNNHLVNIMDITYLISYLYYSGAPPVILNNGDVNGNCEINLLDITYLISYLYMGGPQPVAGCVE